MNESTKDEVRGTVREAYGRIAREGGGCCAPGWACAPSEASRRIGYSVEELAAVPDGADTGLGCGNPQAIAALREGEVVLDLGSGAGLDAFLAARRVGPGGRVIGVDMTPEMIAKARANAAKISRAGRELTAPGRKARRRSCSGSPGADGGAPAPRRSTNAGAAGNGARPAPPE